MNEKLFRPQFDTFNFKLAVMEVLMYEKGLLAPRLDAHESVSYTHLTLPTTPYV